MSPPPPPLPRKAILLAAGFGSRLAPLTDHIPKPLLPYNGVPLIQHLMQQFARAGVRDILVNLHHRADVLLRELPACTPPGVRLHLSFEPTILGTGGALRRMSWFFDDTPLSPLWLCNADIAIHLDPTAIARAFHAETTPPLAALWMIPDQGPRTVRLSGNRVVDFRSGGDTFSGLHLLSPKLLDFIPPEESFSSVISAYEAAMHTGATILGIRIPGSRWADLGTPDQYLDAHQGQSVVMNGAQVHPHTRLQRAIVAPGARLRARHTATGIVLPPHWCLSPAEQQWTPKAEAVEVLPARGSDRALYRIFTPNNTFILIRTGTQRPENLRHAPHTRFLTQHNIRVPALYHASPDERTLLLEDLGRTHLLDQPTPANTRNALQCIAQLHRIPNWQSQSLEPPFSPDLYHWEHTLFAREFLHRHDPHTDPAPILQALNEIAHSLHNEPHVLIHRDLQSTNFLIHRREPVLIDFQGMRAGPAAYDLASFLADPYLNRPAHEQETWLAAYNQISARPISIQTYRLAATQRLIQALGAYGRLGAMPATRRFRQFIPPALQQLARWTPHPTLQKWTKGFLERQTRQNPLL